MKALDPHSGELGAELVRRYFVEEIAAGRLPVGAKVGSERQLADQLGVSRAVVRQVLAGLAEAGLVRRVTGRAGGTFVSRRKVYREPTSMLGVPHYLNEQGLAAQTTVLGTQIRASDEAVAQTLRLPTGSPVAVIRRLRQAEGVPLSVERAVLPAHRFGGVLEHSLTESLYDVLDVYYDTRPAGTVEQIEVALATADEAQHLQVVPGSPLLAVTRYTWDEVGEVFEFSHDLFRADRTGVLVLTSAAAQLPLTDACTGESGESDGANRPQG